MKKIIKFFKDNIFAIIIFFILLVMLFYSVPSVNKINYYTLTFYTLSYFEDGFIPRALIGTIFNLLKINTTTSLIVSLLVISIILIIFISYILNKFINKYKNKIYYIISLLFIFNSASITLMYSNLEIGRLDIFICILSILSLYLIYKNKYLYLIPIISMIGMLIHENYLLWFSPSICSLLLYKYIANKNKKAVLVLITNIIVLLISLCFVLNTKTKYESTYDFAQSIDLRSNIVNNQNYHIIYSALDDYYFVTETKNKSMFELSLSIQETHDYVIAIIGYVLLLFILYNICFKYVYKKVKCKKSFILVSLSHLSPLILFLKGCDYGRWYLYIINSLLCLIFYLYFKYCDEIKKHTNEIRKYIPIIIVYLIVFIFLYQSDQFYLLTYNKYDKFINFIKGLF